MGLRSAASNLHSRALIYLNLWNIDSNGEYHWCKEAGKARRNKMPDKEARQNKSGMLGLS